MSMETNIPFRPVNNDRMAAFSAFRAAMPSREDALASAEMNALNATVTSNAATSAAPVLPSTPAPRTTRLDDTQADGILSALQQEDENELLQVHNNLDANRVAKLLSLLD